MGSGAWVNFAILISIEKRGKHMFEVSIDVCSFEPSSYLTYLLFESSSP